ncbi:MAG: dihydrofolate reductase [Candidatus Cloacimonadota bacterium]
MPDYSIIVAMDRKRLIGANNRMPWRIPEDLAFFRKTTLGHNVIMGRRTWLSLGKALDERTNIVLTTDPGFSYPGVIVQHSLEELESWLSAQQCPHENFVIGGARVFAQFLPLVQRMYITRINHEFTGDTYFPDYNEDDWLLTSYETLLTSSGYDLSFNLYERRGENHAKLG